jgi:hypothetical protein
MTSERKGKEKERRWKVDRTLGVCLPKAGFAGHGNQLVAGLSDIILCFALLFFSFPRVSCSTKPNSILRKQSINVESGRKNNLRPAEFVH